MTEKETVTAREDQPQLGTCKRDYERAHIAPHEWVPEGPGHCIDWRPEDQPRPTPPYPFSRVVAYQVTFSNGFQSSSDGDRADGHFMAFLDGVQAWREAHTGTMPLGSKSVATEAQGEAPQPEIPLCGVHAQSWFTERNLLRSNDCVVCAHEPPRVESEARPNFFTPEILAKLAQREAEMVAHPSQDAPGSDKLNPLLRSCQCVCHKVGLLGFLCCPCSIKLIQDFADSGGYRANVRPKMSDVPEQRVEVSREGYERDQSSDPMHSVRDESREEAAANRIDSVAGATPSPDQTELAPTNPVALAERWLAKIGYADSVVHSSVAIANLLAQYLHDAAPSPDPPPPEEK
jgi:hypothetical protein